MRRARWRFRQRMASVLVLPSARLRANLGLHLRVAAQSSDGDAVDGGVDLAGLRHGELCALRWRDVDYVAARIRVRQNWVLGQYDTPKSRRASRSVPMVDRLAGELERLHRVLGEPGPDALVFADPVTAGPLDKAGNLRRLRKALKAAAVDESHNLHSLRHTFGTAMAAAGVPMRTLQEWMGHRDLKTTQRYADYAPSPHEHALAEAAFARRTVRPI
jgi:integrase